MNKEIKLISFLTRWWISPLLFLIAAVIIADCYINSRKGFMSTGLSWFDIKLYVSWSVLFISMIMLITKAAGKMLWIIPAILFTGWGYYITYYWAYRNDPFFSHSSFTCIILGGLSLGLLISSPKKLDKKLKAQNEKKADGPAWWLLLFIMPILVTVAGYIYLNVKSDYRVSLLLQNEVTVNTIGTITRLKEYVVSGRYNSTHRFDALLEYRAGDKTIYRVINNEVTHYNMGTRIEVKYVVDDPYISEITNVVK